MTYSSFSYIYIHVMYNYCEFGSAQLYTDYNFLLDSLDSEVRETALRSIHVVKHNVCAYHKNE